MELNCQIHPDIEVLNAYNKNINMLIANSINSVYRFIFVKILFNLDIYYNIL